MKLEPDGAQLFAQAMSGAELEDLARLSAQIEETKAGARLSGHEIARRLCAPTAAMGRIAQAVLGAEARPVRALLFDKSAANNWPLGWHQDRTICVRAEADVAGYGPYTRKSGLLHVQPPANLLAGMLTLRAHLDGVDEGNAPLKIARGSHGRGFVPVAEIQDVVAASQLAHCLAQPGDIWAYRTLILHASDAARVPRRRRVLQVDFAAFTLPEPLRWAGI